MSQPDWDQRLLNSQQEWRTLLSAPTPDREAAGYANTLREICHQPATWRNTARLVAWSGSMVAESLENARALVITGSGSSLCAAECAAPAIALECGLPVTVVPGGNILTDPDQALPSGDPALMVSLSRSGDSPDSYAAIDLALSLRPRMKHLVLTCNVGGRLATEFRLSDRVRVIALSPDTQDRGLIMTSSATNLIVAARFIGMVGQAEQYRNTAGALSRIAEDLLTTHADALAGIARSGFRRVAFLGTGARYGAARQASFKMLESTDGRVPVIADTYLSLRHGLMAFIQDETLVVCFLSSSNPARAYELDLIRELNDKSLGCAKLLVGANVPAALLNPTDLAVECPGLAAAGDTNSPVIHILAGQLLALFRGLAEGLRPDGPSTRKALARVVPAFPIHPVPQAIG